MDYWHLLKQIFAHGFHDRCLTERAWKHLLQVHMYLKITAADPDDQQICVDSCLCH